MDYIGFLLVVGTSKQVEVLLITDTRKFYGSRFLHTFFKTQLNRKTLIKFSLAITVLKI